MGKVTTRKLKKVFGDVVAVDGVDLGGGIRRTVRELDDLVVDTTDVVCGDNGST